MTTNKIHLTQEKEATQKGASARSILAAALYHLLIVLMFPATMVGYVLWIGQAYAGRKAGVSGSAQSLLFARWLEDKLGTRPDAPASRLMMVAPGVSHLAIYLVGGPMLIAHRLSGYVPGAFRYPFEGEITMQNQATARQTLYDRVVDRELATLGQFVILGAGFDTRAFRLPKDGRVRSFEIDTPKTMAAKRETVEKAGIDSSGVTFVPADFEKDDWLKLLIDAGFDPGKPALFIWEGVVPYLDREAVETTLRKIASLAKGTVVAFDYFTSEVLESQAFYMRAVRASLNAAGEPLKFGIDSTPPSSEHLAALLQSCGLALVEQHTAGQETDGKRAWGGFATAIVK